MGIDIQVAKNAARGNWRRIATAMLGISEDYLSGKQGPCPKCQAGTDRWRVFDDFDATGGVYCNVCGKNLGDGLELVQWYLNCSLDESISKVCEFLGVVVEKSTKPKKEPKDNFGDDLTFREWLPRLFDVWASTKKPITEEGVRLAGGRFATYRGLTVIAIPILGRDGEPNGYAVYNASGGTIPYRKNKESPLEQLKVRLIGAKQESGWIGRFLPGGLSIKAEGVTDTLAILSANPAGSVVCNPFGAGENPIGKNNKWMVEQFRGETVCTIHDRDQVGVDGATWVGDGKKKRPGWAPALAIVAKESRNLDLPYALSEHGNDSRDFLNDQIESGCTLEQAGQALVALALSAPIVPKPDGYEILPEEELGIESLEHPDDPSRLARLNVEKYQANHGGRLMWWRNQWCRFSEGRWKFEDESYLKAKVNGAVRRQFEEDCLEEIEAYKKRPPKEGSGPPRIRKVTRNLVSNVIASMEEMCRGDKELDFQRWIPDQSKRNYLTFSNGILDLDLLSAEAEKCLLPIDSNWFSMSAVDYPFDENAECPKWMHYLADVTEGDQELQNILQEFAGYLLIPSTHLQRWLILEGGGQNGKTVYLAGLRAMIGEQNVSDVTIDQFGHRFALSSTIGKMLNVSADLGELDSVAEGVIKQFVGGDTLTIDRKNRDPISIRPTAKIIAAWNERPRIKDRSSGMWRRMLIVPFTKSIEAKDIVRGMDDPTYWQGEASGILNWALVGMFRLMAQRDFSTSEKCNEVIDEYKTESNPSAQFFAECVEMNSTQSIPTKELYEKYRAWCIATGHHPLSSANFGKEVFKKFNHLKKIRQMKKGERILFYEGITFSDGF
jgi:P4 family phage/plasmid primase-like protien